MNWDNIQNQWQTGGGTSGAADKQQLLQSIRKRDLHLHRKLKRRDIIETTVALFLAVVMATSAWLTAANGLWASAISAAFLTAWCLFVPWHLHGKRKLIPDPNTSDDMLAYLQAERRATAAQYDLLRGVLRWYLGPAGLGVLVFYAGIRGWSLDTAIYTLVVVALYGLIYLLNQRAATGKLAPAIEQIERQIKDLSEEGEYVNFSEAY